MNQHEWAIGQNPKLKQIRLARDGEVLHIFDVKDARTFARIILNACDKCEAGDPSAPEDPEELL